MAVAFKAGDGPSGYVTHRCAGFDSRLLIRGTGGFTSALKWPEDDATALS
jgi:hypothetical protein